MVKLIVSCHLPQFSYDIEHLIALFFRKNEWQNASDSNEHLEVNNLMIEFDGHIALFSSDQELLFSELIDLSAKDAKLMVKRAVYFALSKLVPSISKWGILVGIRPVKIVHELLDQGVSLEEIGLRLRELYLVAPEKIELLINIAKRERPHLYPIDEQAVSLYVSIPFCPTRCVYCSFPSNAMDKKGKYVSEYVLALVKEIQVSMNYIRLSGRYVDCIYIGGGTPSVLTSDQFQIIFKTLSEYVDLKKLKEFTVEAGRPDAITKDQLEVFKSYYVSRVCVNPQTMNDETLKAIGRDHNSKDVLRAMALVRQFDFPVINMDLILGLPGETLADVKNTIKEVINLNPENITIHTLALKRASDLSQFALEMELAHDEDVADMMAFADKELKNNGLTPYYMYRQKKMVGHLENVGYARKGFSSLYNMRIIEERHTIVALGAGAVSKFCYPRENRHERVANLKGIEEYLRRFDEILIKKKVILD